MAIGGDKADLGCHHKGALLDRGGTRGLAFSVWTIFLLALK